MDGGIFDFLYDIGNYEQRKVGRDEVNGLGVSTAYSSDEGYETAIINGDGEVYPVERYKDKEESQKGHKKWCKRAKTLKKVICLGGLGGFVDDKEVTLIRKNNTI